MTLYGTQAAIDRMQTDPPLTIQVRWVRDNKGWAPGDLNLVTDLTIGGRGLAAALGDDVRRKGSSNGTPGQERTIAAPARGLCR
jgi:hypothetical protein